MENALRELSILRLMTSSTCLNPCFNGKYPQSRHLLLTLIKNQVLILVLMENTLREQKIKVIIYQ